MRADALFPRPEHVLEMFYHRELAYGFHDDVDTAWSFKSAFAALNLHPSKEEIRKYRDYFIEHEFGKFDGDVDPAFRISAHGESVARISIARRKSWYSLRRLETYNWNFWGAVAAILAAILSLFPILQAFYAQAH